MIELADRPRVAAALPLLADLEPELVAQFWREALLARFTAGRDVMALGERVQAVPLVISGSIRVFQVGAGGRAITIYRFGPGECCVLAADSILGERLFPASAQVYEDAEVALVPAPLFNAWLGRFPGWRRFVFGAMAQRLTSLMDTLEEVAFTRMDARVLTLLLARTGGAAGSLVITHQEIAEELGSSREVISRILGRFQDQGLVRVARGEVEVLHAALAATDDPW